MYIFKTQSAKNVYSTLLTHLSQWIFPLLLIWPVHLHFEGLKCLLFFNTNFDRIFCKQTLETLIIDHIFAASDLGLHCWLCPYILKCRAPVAGLTSTRPLFWTSMLSVMSFFSLLPHFSLCLPLIFNLLMWSWIMLVALIIHRPT